MELSRKGKDAVVHLVEVVVVLELRRDQHVIQRRVDHLVDGWFVLALVGGKLLLDVLLRGLALRKVRAPRGRGRRVEQVERRDALLERVGRSRRERCRLFPGVLFKVRVAELGEVRGHEQRED